MPVALETFLSQLSDSGILSDQKLRAAEHKKSEHQDGESLAKEMIKSGHLTKDQAEQILSGKGKNLCMGQYVLQEKLGAGGMGQVYKAFHPGMDRTVAIKVILTKGKIDEESVRRFEREVKAAAKLSHPNIITVYDAGNANGRHFMVMELVKGQDLNVIVHRKGTFGVSETINYIKQVARGLAFAHESGVIHRDIKPANLFLDIKGNVKILDMGLAKISARENEETLSMLTGTTAIMGTVDFMSPEQGLSSRDVDARADIYSLGATLYYFLTKKVMYEGDTAFAKVIAHSESTIPSLKAIRPDVSDDLEFIYTKMVAKQVEDRYQSMLELIQDLDAIEKGSASTKNLTELSTIYSLRDEFGEIDVSKISSKKAVQSSKSNKAIVEKDYRFALIATGIGVVLIGIVALAFILGRSSNSQSELALKSNSANGKVEVVTSNDSAENIKPENPKGSSEKTTPPIIVPKSTAPKPDPAEVFKFAKQIILEPPFLESKIKDAQKELSKILNCETEHQLVLSPNVKMFFSLIPSGKFIKDFDPRIYRIPANKEEFIDYPFLIGKNTVTQEQWNAVMGVKTTNFQPGQIQDLGSPQTFVSWNDCQEFVKVLNQKTNGGYRLPEDLEWDYVFKVDPLGNNQNALKPPGMPNFPGVPRATPGIDGTTGSYKPNVFGLYGGINPNLSEWCENVHRNYQNPFPIDKQAKEKLIASSGTNSIRAMRSAPNGMGWTSNTINGSPASMRNFNYTFRIVKTIITDTDEKIVKAVLSKVLAMVEKDLVLIPAGKFMMGSPTTEVGRKNDETQHQVTLTKPFYMGKYEVTQEQWEGVMGINPSKTKGEKLPVTDVSWNDCQEFIKKLNSKTNGGYRLPTEAEWEYACRAGTTTMYSVGNSLTKSDANIDSDSIKAVGGYKPNTFGLHDMHGNVYEWCEDWKADYPEGAITNPKGPASGSTRVLRGGSFSIYSPARSSFRFTFAPSLRDLVGFRLARTVIVKTTIAPPIPKPDPPIEYKSIKEVMKGLNFKKGAEAASKMDASDADKKAFASLCESLAANKCPKGDIESWKAKTNALVAASKALVAGDKDAGKKVAAAANCRACHDGHKGP